MKSPSSEPMHPTLHRAPLPGSASATRLACAVTTLLTALLLTTTLGANPALAQRDAEALIERGVTLRENGQDAEARDVFAEAFELSGSPRALAQLALAEQAIGDWVSAHEHLTDALQSRARWIRRNRRALAGALETITEHIGTLRIRCEVEGAVVTIDGEERATLPLTNPLIVAAGNLEVRVTAPGFAPAVETVRVIGGQTEELQITLEEAGAVELSQPQPESSAVDTQAPLSDSGAAGGDDPAPWVLVGVSAAVAAGGVVMLTIGRLDAASVEGAERGTRWEDVQGAAERAPALTLAGSVALGVGVAGVVIGVVWQVLSGEESAEQAGVRVAPGAIWGRF